LRARLGRLRVGSGIVLYAVAAEEAVAHPGESLRLAASLALGGGLALFVGGTAAALLRAGRRGLTPRLLLLGGTVVGVWAIQPNAVTWSLLVAVTGALAVATIEQRSPAPVAQT
jgi:hypothetical protein